jgi:hypothetical protein
MGLLPVPRVFLHFHMLTQLFSSGRFLPVTRRRTVRKWIREKQRRALTFGRSGGYHIRRSDFNAFLRKRETIKDDDLSSSCGEHQTKEERCFLSPPPARKERSFIPALERAGLSGPFSVNVTVDFALQRCGLCTAAARKMRSKRTEERLLQNTTTR